MMRAHLFLMALLFSAAACAEQQKLAEANSDHYGMKNEQVEHSKGNSVNYCFYRIENRADWRDISVSDNDTKSIIRFTTLFEANAVLLPAIRFEGKIWLASGCAESLVPDIFPPAQYIITNVPYYEYQDQFKRSSKEYSVIDDLEN